MTTFPLPNDHHYETLVPSSPAVVLGRSCPVTGEPLRPGELVVVCDVVRGADPICVDGWRTLAGCVHCGAATSVVAYVPPAWGSGGWNAPPAPPTPAPAPQRPLSAVGPLAILLLLGALAIAVAAFVFFLRTRPTTAPPPAPTAILPVTATVPLGGVDPATATATGSAATPIAPTPLVVTLTPLGGFLPTPPPSKTPAPPPTLAPTPTPVTPPPASDSPITALTLINPANDRAIRALRAEDSIDLSQIGRNHLNVRAELKNTAVESVTFLLDGEAFCPRGNCVENVAPYYMGGDQGGDSYDDWDWSAMLGQHTLTAIACTGDNGSGECFPPVAVRLTISR